MEQQQSAPQQQAEVKPKGIFRLKGVLAFAATLVVFGLIFVV